MRPKFGRFKVELQARIEKDALVHLYQDLPISLTASAFVTFLVFLAIWTIAPHLGLLHFGWLAYAACVHLLRVYSYVSYRQKQNLEANIARLRNRYLLGAFFAGLMWGLVPSLLMPDNLGFQAVIVIALGGVIVWASHSMAPLPTAFIAFEWTILFPLIAWLILQGDQAHLIVAALTIVFGIGMLWLTFQHADEFRKTMMLRYENLELLQTKQLEVEQRKRTENALKHRNAVLEMLLSGESLDHVLKEIAFIAEERFPRAKATVLLWEGDGFRVHAAPHVSEEVVRWLEVHLSSADQGKGQKERIARLTFPEEEIPYRSAWTVLSTDEQGEGLNVIALLSEQKLDKPSKFEKEELHALANLVSLAALHHRHLAQLQHLSQYDALTDIPNRTLLLDRLKQAIALCKRTKQSAALLFIDLDGFKAVNDQYGHAAGDAVLREVAGRLSRCVRASDTVARLGGDEFAAIILGIHGKEDAVKVAEKMVQALKAPIVESDRTHNIGCSIGISIYPDHGQDAETLLKHADQAMYLAKAKGGSSVQLYAS